MKIRKLAIMNKTSAHREQEAKETISDLKSKLSETLGQADYLRNGFDDVLTQEQMKTLYELTKLLEQMSKKL